MTNKEGRWIFVSALDIGNIGKLKSAPTCDNRRVPNLLEVVERAIQANVNLLSFRIDRSGWSDGILANQCIENISCAYSQSRESRIRELDKDAFRPLPNNVNLLYTGDLKNPLPQDFCFTSKLARRKAWSLDRVQCELTSTMRTSSGSVLGSSSRFWLQPARLTTRPVMNRAA
jgi:hypothetical protein